MSASHLYNALSTFSSWLTVPESWALKLTITILELYTAETLHNVQSHPVTSSSLPDPSEEFLNIHSSTPVKQVTLPCFCNDDLSHSFSTAVCSSRNKQFLLFVTPTGVICFSCVNNFNPDTGVLPPGSSLVSAVLSPSPFKPRWEHSQSALPTHKLEPFFLFYVFQGCQQKTDFSLSCLLTQCHSHLNHAKVPDTVKGHFTAKLSIWSQNLREFLRL